MEELQDFFADFFALEKPERDGSGRPLLIPRGKPVLPENRVAYTRASGLGDMLEEFGFLWKWKMRGLARGLAERQDLVRLAAAETYTCGFTDDIKENRASGRRVDEIIERALDHAGIAEKADYGTAIHMRTEPTNDGIDIDDMQELDVSSCWDLWARLGVVHLGTEIFTANDELRSAGTFDHLSWVPGYGIVVTDKKTSSKAKASYDIQLAGYAHSDIYDVDTDQRMTLEEYVASKGWDPALINRDAGIIWWVKGGKTQARILDLKAGYEWAKIAARIRDERRNMSVAADVTHKISDELESLRFVLLERIQYAPSIDHLNTLWANPAAQAIWTDDHTAAAVARKKDL